MFDKIIVMANSQVLEVGTFAELIERKRYFFKMWDDYERNIKSSDSSETNILNPVENLVV